VGEPVAAIRRACLRAGIEPVFDAVALEPGGHLCYGVVRSAAGGATHHVFHIHAAPLGVLTAVALLVGPLIARLQGGPVEPLPALCALWSGDPHAATGARAQAVPVLLRGSADARLHASPLIHHGEDDLAGFARAEALALLPADSGPWQPGEVVEVIPLGGWPAAA